MVDPNFHQVESWGTPIRGKVVENVEVGGVFLVLFAKFWFEKLKKDLLAGGDWQDRLQPGCGVLPAAVC